VRDDLPGVTRLHGTAAQDLPLDVFDSLQAGDLLFVDTTHTVKLASDVNHIVLDVLPRLAPGVLVHFHDIFLPYEYPHRWLSDYGLYWAEQYLLQAFLACNRHFEILCAVPALSRERADGFAAAVPQRATTVDGSSFWIRRVAD
jgi:hypothetical protein